MHEKLPRDIINKSNILLIQKVCCEESISSSCGCGNCHVIPKFQLKNPNFEKDGNSNWEWTM